jgi:hypothetical protein
MVVEFIDSVTGTPVYINPQYVLSLRPDPADPLNVSIVRLNDGESLRIRGEHRTIADRLRRPA